MQFIFILDFLLLPFYFALIVFIAQILRDKLYPPGHPFRPYFMKGLLLKMGGAIFISLVYQYYYGFGDTMYYFGQARLLYELFWDEPGKALALIFNIPPAHAAGYYEYTSQMLWYSSPPEWLVTTFAALIGLFTFGSYLPIALVFACLSFSGTWAMFRYFSHQYPHLIKYIAVAFLYIPSLLIWGSGILKDTLCMFGIGWFLYMVFGLFSGKRIGFMGIVMGVLGFLTIIQVKVYIVLALSPAVVFMILARYVKKINSPVVTWAFRLSIIPILGFSFFMIFQNFEDELGKYALSKISETAEVTYDYIKETSLDASSTYNLGQVSFTPLGLIKVFPQAVNVALFRPYIWESRKIFILLNAIESFFFLAIVIKLLFQIGLRGMIKAINADPVIQFCLIFTMIFAFAVGLSSGNFGALSRYRIPCLPLFSLALILIYYRHNPVNKNILKLF